MPRRHGPLVTAGLCLVLSGCGWIEEQQRRARLETEFVEALDTAEVTHVRVRLQEAKSATDERTEAAAIAPRPGRHVLKDDADGHRPRSSRRRS